MKPKNDSKITIRMPEAVRSKIKIAALKKGHKYVCDYILDLLRKDGVKVD